MTTHDPNLLKRTLTGIRNIGLDASTRSKMMRIARDYTMGKKRKKLIVFLIAVIGISGLGYGVYQGVSGRSPATGQSQSLASTKTDFKVPNWLGGEGRPKNVSLGKNIARNDYRTVAKHKNKSVKAKKSYAKKGKGEAKYAKKQKGKKAKYAKHKKGKKNLAANKKKNKKLKKNKRGQHVARR